MQAPGGQRLRITRQEFPYDIGIWNNIVQGMGTAIPPLWFFPLGGNPEVNATTGDGLVWEENGFEEPGLTWPPPDPDRMAHAPKHYVDRHEAFVHSGADYGSMAEEVAAFKRRQAADYKRWEGTPRSRGPEDHFSARGDEDDDYLSEMEYEEGMDGEEGWTNQDGDRLRDYGVDEEVDDDDVPLAELIRRRKAEKSR